MYVVLLQFYFMPGSNSTFGCFWRRGVQNRFTFTLCVGPFACPGINSGTKSLLHVLRIIQRTRQFKWSDLPKSPTESLFTEHSLWIMRYYYSMVKVGGSPATEPIWIEIGLGRAANPLSPPTFASHFWPPLKIHIPIQLCHVCVSFKIHPCFKRLFHTEILTKVISKL
jgi:hypothetical protein